MGRHRIRLRGVVGCFVAALLLLGCTLRFAAAGEAAGLFDEGTLRTIELRFSQEDWETRLEANKAHHDATGEDRFVLAELTVGDEVFRHVGVQYRGFSSFQGTEGTRKRPFKISLDAVIENQRYDGRDKVILNNSFLDPSRLREVLAYRIARRYIPASTANWVRLHAGTFDSMADLGIYVNVERVDKSFLRGWFRDADGHRYRAEYNAELPANLGWLGQAVAAYDDLYPLKGGAEDGAYEDLVAVLSAIDEATPEDLAARLEPIFDLDTTLRMLALQTAIANVDSFLTGQNYYLYQDLYHHGRLTPLPWDMDASFRTNLAFSPYFLWEDHPLAGKILESPYLKERYLTHLRTITETEIDWNTLQPVVSVWREFLEDELFASPHEIHSEDDYLASLQTLESTCVERRELILSHADLDRPVAEIEDVTQEPLDPSNLHSVAVSARVSAPSGTEVAQVRLFHRTRGPFLVVEMYDDGVDSDQVPGDGTYTALLPPQLPGARVEYYVEAMLDAETLTFHPPTAEFNAHFYDVAYLPGDDVPLRINEFMARNDNAVSDARGEFDDWVEIYNTSISGISLEGFSLTDDSTVADKWKLPGIFLPGGGTLAFWCDGQPEQGVLHTNFKLDGDRDSILLVSPPGDGQRLVDRVDFVDQVADVSRGRACDGGENFRFFLQPTRGERNGSDCTTGGLVLPGDCQPDGRLNITDAVCLLSLLFLGGQLGVDCEEGANANEGARAVVNLNGDSRVNLSDGIWLLNFLFLTGPPPTLGTECRPIPGCQESCF